MVDPHPEGRAERRAEHRIAKLLARAGVASRREIERMIAEGRVARDGVVLDTPATLLASLDGVTVDGQPVAAPAPARLFLFHKPAGVLTTERDFSERPTIYDRLPEDLPRVVPVGRLDLNTEGLLLLTTDGEFKRELELPATGVERSYRARAYGAVTQEQLEELIHGVEVEGVRYGAIDANLERRTGANVWIEMTLREGKNREVRRVLEHLGLRVGRLIRTRYGPFVLGDLPVGGVGEVRAADLAGFRQTLRSPAATRLPVEPVTVRDQRAARGAGTRPGGDGPRRARVARSIGGASERSAAARPARPSPDAAERADAARGARPATPGVAGAARQPAAPHQRARVRDDGAAAERPARTASDRRARRTTSHAGAPAERPTRSVEDQRTRRAPSRAGAPVERPNRTGDDAPTRRAPPRADDNQRARRAPPRAGASSPRAPADGDAPAPTRPERPKRQPGWAKPKPRSGPPRKGRR
ncbi:pseudouridine synthase [Sphingomonas sp. BK580]|uniref:pseudouridine synthase n=1 Tax=Sphingomonas sp. BK580 TaxID=2586972 RepID=UPI001607B865|nr:pseudouridine synthase [Sphingomonas sp. BK580]MBB3692406.1 23S rRNA pseudouridine2605 synthase [Sphingomonas sp. BK580]